jgi:uncharacterized protein DUF2334
MRGREFVISIHDVTPASRKELSEMVKQLRPRVGTAISAAVIPFAFGQSSSADVAALVHSHCREIALHGYTHSGRCRLHPLAFLSGNSTEFPGLSPVELQARLRDGQRILGEVFGQVSSVFVPPAWCPGALTPAIAKSCGLHVLVTLTSLSTPTRKVPLAVYSWDCGRFATLGYVGELFGHIRCFWRAAIPCVVLHPRDVSRDFFSRALAIIDRFLRDGFSPATFAEVASATAYPIPERYP